MKKVVIVGGGLGGLCTSIRLLHKGYKTVIVEKEKKLGGKINRLEHDNFKFDLTASILITPFTYEKIFYDVDKEPKDYFEMVKLDTLYRVSYFDKMTFDIFYDSEKSIKTLEEIEDNLSIEYYEFLFKSYKKYLLSKRNLLDKPMINFKEFYNLQVLETMFKIKPFYSSYKYLNKIISNSRLKEFLLFQTMYIGVNPYTNSNIYTLIPAISQLQGISYIKGGVYNYIEALERLIIEMGGEIISNTQVDEIIMNDNKVCGVKYDNKKLYSDIVVCNCDYSYAINNLIKNSDKNLEKYKNKLNKMTYSSSVFILYLGLDKLYKNLKVHNIYINKDFEKNIQAAFKNIMPKEFSLYIYYPSIIDETLADFDKSVLNIMVRVPNLSQNNILWNQENIRYIRNKIIDSIKNINGLESIEEHIIYENYLTPKDLKNRFNLTYGNAFGISHSMNQSIYFRPHIKSREIENLYFLNSSTHPGNGASVVIEGSRVLSDLIEKDINKKKNSNK